MSPANTRHAIELRRRSKRITENRARARARTTTHLLGAMCLLALSACSNQPSQAPQNAATSTMTDGPVTATVTAAPDSVTVGDRITLTIDVVADAQTDVTMPQIDDALGPFRVRQRSTPPDVPEGNSKRWTHTYVLGTFQSGSLAIPELTIQYIPAQSEVTPHSDALVQSFVTEPLTLTVAGIIPAEDAANDVSVKEPVAVSLPGGSNVLLWLLLIAAFILIAQIVIIGVLIARRRATGGASVPPIAAHEWALGALRALADRELVEQGDVHTFYVELSGVVREYIERRFGLHAPEQTTREFLDHVRRDDALSSEHKELLASFLRQADMVKFAMDRPDAQQCNDAFEAARGFVEQTSARDADAQTSAVPGGAAA